MSAFLMVQATGLKKIWIRGRLQWHDFHAEFNENVPYGSKVISGWGAEAAYLTRLAFLLLRKGG
jgi:hypothetical protein